jgi:ATP-dependent RNA helicase DHX37/DHR1
MPPCEVSMPRDLPDRYRWFARFLLEGDVFTALKRFTPHLKNRPDILSKQVCDATTHARTHACACY